MDLYRSHQTPALLPAPSQTYLDYLQLSGQDKGVKEFSGASDLSSRPLTPSEVERYHRRQACCAREENSRWWPEQVPTRANGAFTAPHEGTIPVVKVENGQDNIRRQLPGRNNQHSQPKSTPNSLNLPVEDYGQRQDLGTKRGWHEYLRSMSAQEARRLERPGISAQQYYNERAMVQQKLSLPVPPEPRNHLLPPALLNAGFGQEAEQRKLAQREEQKREQEKAQLPAAKPGNLYPRPSRMSGPVRTVHDDDLERKMLSLQSMGLKPSESYRKACRPYYEKLARQKEEERRKAAVSVPALGPTRTESVKQLLSSVNKALEQKVQAAELEAADTECLEGEAPRAQSQQRQDQNDVSQAARQCGENFWYEYSANYPTARCSSMTTQWSQSSDSAPAQPLVTEAGHSIDEDGLADRIRTRLRRNRLGYSPETTDYRPATEAINKVPGGLLETPRTASGQKGPSSLKCPVVSTTFWNREKRAADDPHVLLAGHKDSSADMSENDVSSLPAPEWIETGLGPEVGAISKIYGSATWTVPLGALDVESEWEEVNDDDDDVGDEGWTDVEGDDVGDDAQREISDVEWASDTGSEGAF